MTDRDDGNQPRLPLVDTHAHRSRGFELIEACRAIAKDHGWERCARELDATFIKDGRPVSDGTLRNALRLDGNERNYPRMEWVPYFASLSDEPAQIVSMPTGKLLAHPSQLKPEDELALVKEQVLAEFGAAGARLLANIGRGGRRRR